jgi:hypothetical protein
LSSDAGTKLLAVVPTLFAIADLRRSLTWEVELLSDTFTGIWIGLMAFKDRRQKLAAKE